ncbi:MAG: carboxymuconolactone decarboxylase family protein [Deltaproteobacteria bacterium]|nr:carboxymuconolactone decarboxylase family protein [Deltaproteobacteria bacterium]
MPFSKRTPGSLREYAYWLWETAQRVPSLVRTESGADGIDGRFREEVMLAVTAVNDCRYCRFVHGSLAEYEGVELDEIQKMMKTDWEPGDQRLAAAVHYARECAEAGKLPPSKASRAALGRLFDEKEVRAIEASIAGIMVGNLTGNTFDALLARFTGERRFREEGWVREAVIASAALAGGLSALAMGAAARGAARLPFRRRLRAAQR